MTKEAEIYVPSVAEFPEDLRLRHDLLEPARLKGYQTGLMLVIKPQGLTPERVQRQLDNLDPYVGKPISERPAVFGMHPNKPLTGERRFNFLDNPNWSQEYLERSIEFVAKLPPELTPSTGKALSFHLNTLLYPDAWKFDQDYWARVFEGVLARIKASAEFAKRQGVTLAVETVPITEFGDMARTPEHLMDDGHTFWADLGNPWPLLFWRDEIKSLRQAGTNIAIDICHSFIALRTVQEVKRLAKEGKKKKALDTYMLFESDLEQAPALDQFAELVIQNTQAGDIWHMNDAKGMYKTKDLHGNYAHYREGIALFEGDIPVANLQKLVKEGLNKSIKYVLEINETDFVNSPNIKKSLERVLKEAKEI